MLAQCSFSLVIANNHASLSIDHLYSSHCLCLMHVACLQDILLFKREPLYELSIKDPSGKPQLILEASVKVGEAIKKIEAWLFGPDAPRSAHSRLSKRLYLPSAKDGLNKKGCSLRLMEQKHLSDYGIKKTVRVCPHSHALPPPLLRQFFIEDHYLCTLLVLCLFDANNGVIHFNLFVYADHVVSCRTCWSYQEDLLGEVGPKLETLLCTLMKTMMRKIMLPTKRLWGNQMK